MNRHRRQFGFSLTEVLIATGIMAIGLVMVATVFPVGVKLTTLSTERTLGAVAADEAFAKVQLYGLRDFIYWPSAQIAFANSDPRYAPNWANATYETCDDFQYVTDYTGPDGLPGTIDDNYMQPGPDGSWGTSDDIYWDSEFQYPSSMTLATQDRNYHWSALCRRVGAKDVQVTVFVNRRIAAGAQYRAWDPFTPAPTTNSPWPKPVPVNVDYFAAAPRELIIKDNPAFPAVVSRYFFGDGYTIMDNLTGKIYRILEVKDADGDNHPDTLLLMEDWQWAGYPVTPAVNEVDRTIWVVPSAVNSDRYPCVGVYQKVIRFDAIQ